MIDSLRTVRRGVALVAVASPGKVVLYGLLMVTVGLVPVAQAWLAKLVVDGLAAGAPGPRILLLVGLYASALAALAGLQPLERAMAAWLEGRAVAAVDRALMAAGGRLVDLYRVERPAFGDELRLLDGAPFYIPRIFQMTRYILGGGVTLGGLLLLLGGLHPLLPLVLAALTVPRMATERRMQNLMYEAMSDGSRAGREMDYCARVATGPELAKELRVFGLGAFFLGRFRERLDAALGEVSRLRLRHLRIAAVFGVLQALALAGGFWYVAARVGEGALPLGDIALYLAAVIQAQTTVAWLVGSVSVLYETRLYLRGLFAFLDGAAPVIRLPAAGREVAAPTRLREGIRLEGISFAYPEGERPVLDGVSVALRAGEVTALVGVNGAGKSTVVKLLTRMYDPTGGEILLDGRPLQEYDLDGLRRRIAVVYQDFARFALTLGENISVGAAVPDGEDGRVEEAARMTGAHDVAIRLPRGYDTQLTRRFEGGVDLSGGEWQKLALARGFVRDAALVILDEPTSALDAEAEHELFERFRELVAGRTGLLISHRFSTVRMADRIVVLEAGRVVEEGGHEELVERGGVYAELFEMQAGRYRQGRSSEHEKG
jgi:ATP-binding cassette subfamily B protein